MHKVGDVVTVTLPYSEVCMFMRLSGVTRPVLIKEHGAQILKEDGAPQSFPITHGEAGFLSNGDGTFRHIG